MINRQDTGSNHDMLYEIVGLETVCIKVGPVIVFRDYVYVWCSSAWKKRFPRSSLASLSLEVRSKLLNIYKTALGVLIKSKTLKKLANYAYMCVGSIYVPF